MASGAKSLDKVDAILMLALTSLTLALYTAFLTRSPLIYGWDGPYYLVQVRHIARTGFLKHGDPPLAFYYFYAISVLIGDITLGVKLGTAIMVALMAIPTYCLVKMEVGRRPEAVLGSMALAINPQLLRLSSEWLKNLVGSTFMLFSVFFFVRGVRHNRKGDLIASSIFLVASGLTHILALCTSLLFLILFVALTAICHRERAAEALEAFILVSLAPATIILVGLPLFPMYFSDFLKVKAFLTDLLWPSATSSYYMPLLAEQWMAYTVLGLSVIGFFTSIKHITFCEREKAILTMTFSLIGIFISAPITPPVWYQRLSLMGFLPTSFLVPMIAHEVRVLSDIAPILPRRVRHELTFSLAAFYLMLPMLALSRLNAMFIGPSLSDVELSDLVSMASIVPERSVVIAPNQALGYWAEYIFDCDFAKKLSPDLFTRYKHVLLLVMPGEKPLLPMRLLCTGQVLALYELMPLPSTDWWSSRPPSC